MFSHHGFGTRSVAILDRLKHDTVMQMPDQQAKIFFVKIVRARDDCIRYARRQMCQLRYGNLQMRASCRSKQCGVENFAIPTVGGDIGLFEMALVKQSRFFRNAIRQIFFRLVG